MMQPLKIAVGIPTYKRPNGLRRVLKSLEHIVTVHDVTVVVAENDREGREGMSVAEEHITSGYRYPIKIALSKARGISQARNALMETAFADPEIAMLVMVDDDQWVKPDWLTNIVDMQTRTGADIVGGYILPDFQTAEQTWLLKLSVYWRRRGNNGVVPVIETTGSVLITRAVLDLCDPPYFDEAFSLTGGGDREFFTRLANRGARFAFAENAIVYEVFEQDRLSLAWARRRSYRVGASDMLVNLKHSRGPGHFMLEIAKIGAGLVRAAGRYLVGIHSPLKRTQAELLMLRTFGKVSTLFGMRYEMYRKTSGN